MSPVQAALALAFVAAGASHAPAAPRLGVSGSATVRDDQLAVDVRLTNSGDVAAEAVSIRATLEDVEQMAVLDAGLGPGDTRRKRFSWPTPRPGTHAVLLRLAYREAGQDTDMQQPAWLLVAVGSPAPTLLDVVVPERIALKLQAPLRLRLSSSDGQAHSVRLRFATPDGLRVLGVPEAVDVPATGERAVDVRVLGAGVRAGTVQGVAIAATTLDGDVAATSIATLSVAVEAPAYWTEQLRTPAIVLAVSLMLAGVLTEWRHSRRSRQS